LTTDELVNTVLVAQCGSLRSPDEVSIRKIETRVNIKTAVPKKKLVETRKLLHARIAYYEE
jgi:hypothetical protein